MCIVRESSAWLVTLRAAVGEQIGKMPIAVCVCVFQMSFQVLVWLAWDVIPWSDRMSLVEPFENIVLSNFRLR